MTERRKPKPGVGTDLVVIRTYVSVAEWNDVKDRVEKAGVSLSSYVRGLFARDELTAGGVPVWLSPAATADELPGMEGSAA